MSELAYLGIRIPQHLEDEIKSLVKDRRYKNKTDVVITALRLLIHQELPIIKAQEESY